MSELDGMAGMARLELEILKDGTKAAIDISRFGWERLMDLKKLALFAASLKYAKTKGATNIKNIMAKTNGNVSLVQIPDECQKDFEAFCSKNGVLCSKMYDFNLADGNKQYMFDANMADLVFQAFAGEMKMKYEKVFLGNAERCREEAKMLQEDIYRNDVKRQKFEAVLKIMEEGGTEKGIPELAKAMGYKDENDQSFQKVMQDKVKRSGTDAYVKEAEIQMQLWENRVRVKKREVKEKIKAQNIWEKKAQHPVFPITYEDYLNTAGKSMEEFEENIQRKTADENCPIYEKLQADKALRQDTPVPEEKKAIERPLPIKQDYIYASRHPDSVITRSYYKEIEDGQTVGCYHILSLEKDGIECELNDRGMGQAEYQTALSDFLKYAGLEESSRVMVFTDLRELEAVQKIDKEIAEEPPVPKEVMHPKAEGEEDNLMLQFAEKEKQREQESRKNEQLAKEYSEPVTKYKIFKDPSLPDRVRIPVVAEGGTAIWMVELPEESITSDDRGNMQIHFNGSDQMKAFDYQSIQEDGTVKDSSECHLITGEEFRSRYQNPASLLKGKEKTSKDIPLQGTEKPAEARKAAADKKR